MQPERASPSQGLHGTDASSVREKLWLVFKATRMHARNLATFATIYKLTLLLLKRFGTTPGKEGAPSPSSSLPAAS